MNYNRKSTIRFIKCIITVVLILVGLTCLITKVTYTSAEESVKNEIKAVTEAAVVIEEIDAVQISQYDIPLVTELQQFIWDTCNSYGINGVCYEYVIAVIKKENSEMDSNETNYNVDGSVDRGLFQLNDNTSYKLAKDLKIENFDPYDPYENIEVGIYYLNIMYQNFSKVCSNEDTFMAVAAGYNQGGNDVMKDIQRHGIRVVYENEYAKDVLNNKIELETTNTIK